MRLKSLNHTRVDHYTGQLTYEKVSLPETRRGTDIYGKYRLIGDYTPTYAYGFSSLVPNKIQHVTPNAKIIFSLRDPVDRALSHINYIFRFIVGQAFAQKFGNDTEAMSWHIHELFLKAIEDYNLCYSMYCENYCATHMPDRGDMFAESVDTAVYKSLIISLYHISIAKYMTLFPQQNILVVDLGEFSHNPVDFMEETVLPFLGLDPYGERERDHVINKFQNNNTVNTNTQPLVEFLPETIHVLREFFYTPQLKLSKLLNGRHFSWFDEYGI